MKTRLALALGTLLMVVGCGPVPEPRAPRPDEEVLRPTAEQVRRVAERFGTLESAFLDWYYEAHPVRATALGIHTRDGHLPAHDRTAIQRRIDDYLDWLTQLEAIPLNILEDEDRYDYAVLEFAIRSELLTLEEIRPWVHDPRHYTAIVAEGLSGIAARAYAPMDDRVAALASRMREALPLLEAARTNIRNPPRLWTELAVEDTRGLIAYLRDDLPAALALQGGGGGGAASLVGPTAALTAALESHAAWLEGVLLPRSTGDYRLGAYLFQRKLLYDEHVNLGVAELQRLNDLQIAAYTARVEATAAEIDPDRTPRAIMDSITRIHPTPGELIPLARQMMLEARTWVREAELVSLPTAEIPEVMETPPFARGGFASMDAPGPFSEPGLEAYYYITNVDPGWSEEQQRQHLTYFNVPGLLGVTVHETFPGHFVQLAFMRNVDSRIRRTFMPRSLTEGWAHYVEQVVLDEGFRDDDPGIRLGQLRRALQRHARWDAALQLHASGSTIDEVVPRFMRIAYFDEFPARREVIRATYDPTYLYYALGRIQILELREAYQKRQEERRQPFSLREFHDRLLGLGLPLSLASEAMLNAPRGPRLQPLTTVRR